MSDTDLALLSPYEGPAIHTPNRVVLAPMTRNRAGESRVANPLMASFYAQRASAGLLISESVDISEQAIGYPGTPGIYSDEMVAGWAHVVQTVRAAQPVPAPFYCQLFHTGRVSHVSLRADRSPGVAPSAIAAPMQLYTAEGLVDASVPHALTQAEIASLVADFVRAAERAIEAGFDGVEINAGNGYLLHQFLADGTNRRDDRYGGGVEGRLRLAVEVVEAVSEAIGAEHVALRVSPVNQTNGVSDSDPSATHTALAAALAGRGLAYFHVIEACATAHVTPQIREAFDGTLIVNDGYDRDTGESAVRDGRADLVSYGRAFLANPDLPRRFELSAPLNAADPATFYGGDHNGYTTYPALDA